LVYEVYVVFPSVSVIFTGLPLSFLFQKITQGIQTADAAKAAWRK
jgi:hypothetical protein